MRHIHLHPLGGVAGDMFVACLLDAFPEHRPAAIEAAQSLASVDCRLVPHNDGTLAGSRFLVDDPGHGHHHDHHHTSWRDIRTQLAAAALAPAVRAHAIGIFAVLAEAEGRVHGVPADDVTFHEVGAVDSIADIVAAAALIEAVGPARWTVASLPVGGGTVRTAHGPMPVPAPATALLLEGFAMHDDGIAGERVTPLARRSCATSDAAPWPRSAARCANPATASAPDACRASATACAPWCSRLSAPRHRVTASSP